jgi:hypothetical protein
MQGLLILALVIAVIIFFLPMILGAVIFFICVAAFLLLIARIGLLPGARFKGHKGYSAGPVDYRTPNSTGRRRRFRFEDEERDWREEREGWYDSLEEGEEIILPESALHKDDGAQK